MIMLVWAGYRIFTHGREASPLSVTGAGGYHNPPARWRPYSAVSLTQSRPVPGEEVRPRAFRSDFDGGLYGSCPHDPASVPGGWSSQVLFHYNDRSLTGRPTNYVGYSTRGG